MEFISKNKIIRVENTDDIIETFMTLQKESS